MDIFAYFWCFYANLHLCLGSPLNSQQLIVSGSPLTPQQLILSVRFPFNTPTADSARSPPVLSGKAPCETCSQTESSLQCHPTGQSECRKSQLPFLPAPVSLWWRWLDRWFLKAHRWWLERWFLKAHKWWLERWLLKAHKLSRSTQTHPGVHDSKMNVMLCLWCFWLKRIFFFSFYQCSVAHHLQEA